jgi:hypothetical protein
LSEAVVRLITALLVLVLDPLAVLLTLAAARSTVGVRETQAQCRRDRV